MECRSLAYTSYSTISHRRKAEQTNVASHSSGAKGPCEEEIEDGAEVGHKKALRRTPQMQAALQATAELWNRTSKPWPQTENKFSGEDWCAPKSTTIRKKPVAAKKEAQQKVTAHQCRAYINFHKGNGTTWLQKLSTTNEKPTTEQTAFLNRVVERCQQE